VVVCDHNPPAIDAVSIFKEMTRMNDLRPFIIMTKQAEGDIAIKAFELRMDYYLSRENVMNFYMELASKIVLCAERKRMELDRILNEKRMRALLDLVMMREKEFEEILNYALEESVALTNSTIGYIATYSEETDKLTMEAWSKGGLDRCNIVNRKTTYDLGTTGLWGEPFRQGRPIIVNDYQNEATHEKKGTPMGHVQMNRLMMIPIYHKGKFLATAGVGNKIQEYTSDDLMQFTLLMDGLISIYHERIMEEENIKSERNLKDILQNAPVGIILVDDDMSIRADNNYARSVLSSHSMHLSKVLLTDNPSELSRLICKDIEKVRVNGQRREFEHWIEEEERNLVFKVNIARTRGEKNEDSGFIVIIDDISEMTSMSRHNIATVERISLLDTLMNNDIRKLLAKVEKEMENIPGTSSAGSVRDHIRAINEIMTFVEEYQDVGIRDPQWQSLGEVLLHAMEAGGMNEDSVKYNVKGIRILADPAFYNVFSQLFNHSRNNSKDAVKCSIKCRLEDRDLIIQYSDNSAGIPYEKKYDFVSDRKMEYGRGIYLAFSILKACGFKVRESGVPGKGMTIEMTVPVPNYSISWE
jgi:PAS domain-containing protein